MAVAMHVQSEVKQSVLSGHQSVEMSSKHTIYGFIGIQRECEQRKSYMYLLYFMFVCLKTMWKYALSVVCTCAQLSTRGHYTCQNSGTF